MNISNIAISNNVTGLLQLCEGFCLLISNKEKNTIECIKAVENNFYRHKLKLNNTFRNMLFPLIKEIKNYNTNKIDRDILTVFSTTKKFVADNPNVIITRADKGNTVTLYRMDYMDKMEKNLSDTDTYILLQRNSINKLIENLKKILKHWLKNGYISSYIHSQLNSSNAILSRVT